MRHILLLAAFLVFAVFSNTARAGDSHFDATKDCDAFDYDCNHPRDKKLFNDDADQKDQSKSEKPQDAVEPRDAFDSGKKPRSIGDIIGEQLKKR
jgi:hypothetical protein